MQLVLSKYLVVNLSKTNYVIFHCNPCNNKDVLDNVSLSINSVPLKKVNSVNFLGVHIQSNMHWDIHITNVANKISTISSKSYQTKEKVKIKVIFISKRLKDIIMIP